MSSTMLSEDGRQMLLVQAAAKECRSETSMDAFNSDLSFFRQTWVAISKDAPIQCRLAMTYCTARDSKQPTRASPIVGCKTVVGGEGGIRTHGPPQEGQQISSL